MAALTAEYFTDPLSPWCWAAGPTVRRLEYEIEQLELVPRMSLLLPDAARADWLPGGTTPETLGEQFAAVVRGSGMPVAEGLWEPDPPSSSVPACAAVAFVRETAADRVERFLHRVREAAFAANEPVDSPDRLCELAAEVGGIDSADLGRAIEDGRAVEALAGDVDRACAVAAEMAAGDVRGDVGRLLAAPRRALLDADDPTDDPPVDSGPPDDRQDGETETMVAPPTIRFQADDRVVIADARIGYQRLAVISGRAVPRQYEEMADEYGTGRLAAHVGRQVAEQVSARDFLDEVRAYLTRFERAYVAEIAAGTGRSPETCRSCLERLAEAGTAEPVDAGGDGWRMIEGGRVTT